MIMKNVLLLFFILFVTSLMTKAQVIFNPATFEPGDSLAPGMSIVSIDGKNYLQVILDGWNSYLDVPEITLGTSQVAKCDFKYSLCAASDDTLDLSNINGVVQIMDTVNRVPNPWGAGTIPAATGISESPVSGSWAKLSMTVSSSMKKVHQIQFFGQQKLSWGPTVGDTLWIAKVQAVTTNPNVILDPREIDPTELPAGMSIANIDGTDYIQVILDGWNSNLYIKEFTLKSGMTATCKFKYSLCTASDDTLDLSNINAVVQLMDTVNRVPNPWGAGTIPSATGLSQSPVDGNLVALSNAMSADMKIVNEIQFFGQQKLSWGPTVGDTIWAGIIMLADKAKPSAPANLAATVDGSTVNLTWEASTDNATVTGYIVSQADVVLDTISALLLTVNDLANGSYTFKVTAMDNSGNLSAASTVEATVGVNSIENTDKQKLLVYPNPANSFLNILNAEVGTIANIYSISGELVLSGTVDNSRILDISSLQSGIYYIRLSNTNMNSEVKLIKK
jgi:hypothetical protein